MCGRVGFIVYSIFTIEPFNLNCTKYCLEIIYCIIYECLAILLTIVLLITTDEICIITKVWVMWNVDTACAVSIVTLFVPIRHNACSVYSNVIYLFDK